MTQRTGLTWGLPLLVGLAVLAPAGFARSIHVDAGAHGANNGATWGDAYVYLQDALAASRTGDQILIAQGVYRTDRGRSVTAGDRTASFSLKSGVSLRGGYAGSISSNPNARNVKAYRTILSGDLAGNDLTSITVWDLGSAPSRTENSYHVVTADRVTGATLDGIHITGGHANEGGASQFGRGGGVSLTRDAEATLVNCTLTANYGRLGGAVCNFGAAPLLVDCDLQGNLAESGGGLAVRMGPATVIGCRFRRNAATAGGGAIWSDVSQGWYINCSLCGNMAMDSGGGINAQLSTLEIVNALLCGNASACSGGALNVGGCPHRGGTGGSQITLMNCTLAENRASQGRAIQSFGDASAGSGASSIRVGNSLLRNGGDEVRNSDGSTIEVTFSNVQGGYSGDGNIDADPAFAASGRWSDRGTFGDIRDDVWTEGDYRVSADSPCVDVDYGRFVPRDTMDLDGDGDILEVIPVDMRSRPRVARKPGQREPSTGPHVDMGAYEYQDSRKVHRFWSPVFSRHFYTISDLEQSRLIRDYSHIWIYEEGSGFETLVDGSNPDAQPVHRFWAPGHDTHFYTIDEQEKNKLINEASDVWVYEGVVFYAHAEGRQPSLAKPVYRFWSPIAITHFYTIDPAERDSLIDEFPYAWIYEGIAWYAYELSK